MFHFISSSIIGLAQQRPPISRRPSVWRAEAPTNFGARLAMFIALIINGCLPVRHHAITFDALRDRAHMHDDGLCIRPAARCYAYWPSYYR